MKAAVILALLASASPAFAQAAAPAPDTRDEQKPYIFDSPAHPLKSFAPPTPVTVVVPGDPVPKVGPLPPKVELRTPVAPPEKPAPEQPKKGFG